MKKLLLYAAINTSLFLHAENLRDYIPENINVHEQLHRSVKAPFRAKKIAQQKNQILLKTVKRTGTNLTMAILTYLTDKPCIFSHDIKWAHFDVLNRPQVKINMQTTPIFASHDISDVKDMKSNKLIITCRDYKEVFFRNGNLDIPDSRINEYFGDLKLFDSWPKQRRLIVYYEELKQRPKSTISKIARFLGVNQNKVNQLMSVYPQFKKKILKSYDQHMGTKHDGENVTFHQQKVSNENKERLKKRMKAANPYLYEKYLKRYG